MKDMVSWEVHNRIGSVILNSPPCNSMNGDFFQQLDHLTTNIIPASGVIGIIIYGKGRHFSSGADVGELVQRIHSDSKNEDEEGSAEYPPFLFENNKSFLFFDQLKIPVISAIRGICIGSALELALFSHIRLCGNGAVLGFPEVSFNLMPGCGGIQKLVSFAGVSKSMEIVLTGENLTSSEAQKLGLVDAVLPKKNLIEIATDFAIQIAADYSRYKIKSYINKLNR